MYFFIFWNPLALRASKPISIVRQWYVLDDIKCTIGLCLDNKTQHNFRQLSDMFLTDNTVIAGTSLPKCILQRCVTFLQVIVYQLTLAGNGGSDNYLRRL